MKATCEREIFKLFRSQNAKDVIPLSQRKIPEENLKTEYFLSCGKNSAFSFGLQTANRVLKCDVIKMKFLKSWDLSGYSERTMSKRPTCQK